MQLLDERGRLFGRVNVVDAAVVVVVITVLVAGIAVVTGGSGTEDDGAAGDHATVLVHGGGAMAVENGTTFRVEDRQERFRVTDAARVVTGNGSTALVARVALDCGDGGLLGNDGGCGVTPGDRLPARGQSRTADLEVLRVGSGSALNLSWTPVLARATVPAGPAAAVDENDTIHVHGDPVVEIERATTFLKTNSSDRRLRLGLRVRTLSGETSTPEPIRTGSRVGLETDRYRFDVDVGTVGRARAPGERVERTLTLQWREVDPAVAAAVETGDRLRGTSGPTRVVARESGPARVVVQDSEGQLHERDHPRLRRVTLEVETTVRRYDDALWFQDRRLEIGRTVVLDAGDATVVGEVVAVDGSGNADTNATASG